MPNVLEHCPKVARSRDLTFSTNHDRSVIYFGLSVVMALEEYHNDQLLKLCKYNYKLNTDDGYGDRIWTRSLTELDTGAALIKSERSCF